MTSNAPVLQPSDVNIGSDIVVRDAGSVPPILQDLGWMLISKQQDEGLDTLDPEITAACDHACCHCWADLTGKHMNLETFRKVLEFAEIAGVKTLQFTGGEPTLNPDFPEMAKLAKEQEFALILRTHGRTMRPDYLQSLLNRRMREERDPIADVVARYFDEVIISIDGDADDNYAMRPSNSGRDKKSSYAQVDTGMQQIFAQRQYSETLAGLRALSDAAKTNSRNEELKIRVNTVVARQNFEGMNRLGVIIQQLKDEGINISRWDITQVMSSYIATTHGANPNDYMISDEEFYKAVADASRPITNVEIRAKGITDARCFVISSACEFYVGGSGRVPFGSVVDSNYVL